MTALTEAYEAVIMFFDSGGDVLEAIFVVTLLMWVLIGERLWYLRWGYKHDQVELLNRWQALDEKNSWHAKQIRSRLISVMKHNLNHSLAMVVALVAVCPLFGLLGTVSGMIEVFDVMAITGNGNPRAMAGGVSAATIPTMAGMVAAISGLFFSFRLVRSAEELRRSFAAQLKE
ncbi:MAG: biopolymer transporter ExbB [Deltaproteobacteria bacterium RIFOXYA12_FULL_58_15]|nr:MAG: biopolymer transporter ExbB [Deltaproteobacteria bacterium RIFOXYA12_FULL_58_15]OGR09155.1 MAG: biopolymer transporter ExbB [Deltaproteobacteria bacterium RIFOXYB12_FULL_58_9]